MPIRANSQVKEGPVPSEAVFFLHLYGGWQLAGTSHGIGDRSFAKGESRINETNGNKGCGQEHSLPPIGGAPRAEQALNFGRLARMIQWAVKHPRGEFFHCRCYPESPLSFEGYWRLDQ